MKFSDFFQQVRNVESEYTSTSNSIHYYDELAEARRYVTKITNRYNENLDREYEACRNATTACDKTLEIASSASYKIENEFLKELNKVSEDFLDMHDCI